MLFCGSQAMVDADALNARSDAAFDRDPAIRAGSRQAGSHVRRRQCGNRRRFMRTGWSGVVSAPPCWRFLKKERLQGTGIEPAARNIAPCSSHAARGLICRDGAAPRDRGLPALTSPPTREAARAGGRALESRRPNRERVYGRHSLWPGRFVDRPHMRRDSMHCASSQLCTIAL